jgi:glycosyltransferase involved in cell wall biosynthesis
VTRLARRLRARRSVQKPAREQAQEQAREQAQHSALLSVVVPAYGVEDYLADCLDSILRQSYRRLEVVVVDDGSPDRSGEIADRIAAGDERVRVLHIDNRGLGAARNEGVRHATGELLAFADSDDLVPDGSYSTMVEVLQRTAADVVTGDVARLEGLEVLPLPWSSRLHPVDRTVVIGDVPDLLGDVFAWNKVFRRAFWDRAGLSWPEGVRYEDQPTSTLGYLRAARIAVTPVVVYHWRMRSDGSSITQQRALLDDLRDRWETKRMTLDSVRREGTPELEVALLERILPADMWRYFELIPAADDAWWDLLVAGVRELWGEHSLTHSVLAPVHRLTGWLVEQGRRDDAVTVISHLRTLDGRRVARVADVDGPRLDVPGLDSTTVSRDALALRPGEA